jgi:septum formation protein
VQGRAAVFIERISGSYSGIVGLPLFETAALLASIGWNPSLAAEASR